MAKHARRRAGHCCSLITRIEGINDLNQIATPVSLHHIGGACGCQSTRGGAQGGRAAVRYAAWQGGAYESLMSSGRHVAASGEYRIGGRQQIGGDCALDHEAVGARL